MIEELATVTACDEKYAEVQALRQNACGDCAARSGCGTKALSEFMGNRRVAIRALNPIDAKPGDQVVIGVQEKTIAKASLAAYLVPLISLIAFAWLGEAIGRSFGIVGTEPFSIAGGSLGLVLGFGWLHHFSARLNQDIRFQAVILRRTARSGMVYRPVTRGD